VKQALKQVLASQTFRRFLDHAVEATLTNETSRFKTFIRNELASIDPTGATSSFIADAVHCRVRARVFSKSFRCGACS
jgi:hypothetical protein